MINSIGLLNKIKHLKLGQFIKVRACALRLLARRIVLKRQPIKTHECVSPKRNRQDEINQEREQHNRCEIGGIADGPVVPFPASSLEK